MSRNILLLLALLIFSRTAFPCEVKGVEKITTWDNFGAKLVNELVLSSQISCHAELVNLLSHDDPSIRVMVAEKVSRRKLLPEKAIPALIANFSQPSGEEGIVYFRAVAEYGKQAEALVLKALESESWLVRKRACDSLMLIRKTKNMTYRNICET